MELLFGMSIFMIDSVICGMILIIGNESIQKVKAPIHFNSHGKFDEIKLIIELLLEIFNFSLLHGHMMMVSSTSIFNIYKCNIPHV